MELKKLNIFLYTCLYLLTALLLMNGINMVLSFMGISITIPVMVLYVLAALYFLSVPVPQKQYLVAYFFVTYFSYLFVSLLSYYLFDKTSPEIDVPYQIRTILYNMIIVFVTYRFVQLYLNVGLGQRILQLTFIVSIIGGVLTLYSGLFGLYPVEIRSYLDNTNTLIEERLSGIYLNPNLAGFAATIGLVVSFSLLYGKSVFIKILGLLGVIFSYVISAATFSKTSILQSLLITGLFIMVTVFNWTSINTKVRRHILGVTAIILILLVQSVAYIYTSIDELMPEQQDRVRQIETLLTSGKLNSEITTSRSDAFDDGVDQIAEHTFIGNGFGSFRQLKNASERVGEKLGIHNSFLLVLGEAGVLVFFLYIVMHVLLLVGILKIQTVQLKFFGIALFVATAVYNTTNHEVFDNPIQAVILGVLLALASYGFWPVIIISKAKPENSKA